MRIISAIKERKAISQKIEDLSDKIGRNGASMDNVKPSYDDQTGQIKKWQQSIRDLCGRYEILGECIDNTNINTNLTILIDGKEITKSVKRWVARRRVTLLFEKSAWSVLRDRDNRGRPLEAKRDPNPSNDGKVVMFQIARFYDKAEKDRKIIALSEEDRIIDSALEISNVETELIGLAE